MNWEKCNKNEIRGWEKLGKREELQKGEVQNRKDLSSCLIFYALSWARDRERECVCHQVGIGH